jgi:hypothetical protein
VSVQVICLGTGKCSDFGGPDDQGVEQLEGLALVSIADLTEQWFARNFYPPRPHIGLARSLNPNALYCAMQFAYGDGDDSGKPGPILPGVTHEQLQRAIFAVSAGGKTIFVQAVDWGPDRRTGRLIDLSPGAMRALDLATDDIVSVEAILPGGAS